MSMMMINNDDDNDNVEEEEEEDNQTRSSCDIYSVVDIPGFAEQPTVSKSNVVVDTIRLISGIPHSRLATIMEEEEEEEEEEEVMEVEYERQRGKSSQTLLRSMNEESTPFAV